MVLLRRLARTTYGLIAISQYVVRGVEGAVREARKALYEKQNACRGGRFGEAIWVFSGGDGG